MPSKYFSSTICWKCANACTDGCSWAERFEPVEGWVATPMKTGKGETSYEVLACPEFRQDPKEARDRIEDLNTDGCLEMIERLMEVTREDYFASGPEGMAEIERFIRGKGASRIHMIVKPDEVIEKLKKDRIEYRKRKYNRDK